VKLYLPRACVGASVSVPPPAEPARAEDETVLVVEDEPDVRGLAVRMLRDLGYHVLEAGDAETALRLLAAASPPVDLMLADAVLSGGMGGQMLAAEAERRHLGLRVLFMSGYTENAVVHQGRLDDGVALLQKPFRKPELARKIRQALNRNP